MSVKADRETDLSNSEGKDKLGRYNKKLYEVD
jgi:hypothetical protein